MREIKEKHPEIVRFKEDQRIVSKPVRNFLKNFVDSYPQQLENLLRFINKFSDIDISEPDTLSDLREISGYAYKSDQESKLIKSLEDALSEYPVPAKLKGIVKQGEYLDLRSEENEERFTEQLDKFVVLIKSLDQLEAIEFDTSVIGKLELDTIHDSNSDSEIDRLIDKKVNKIWTLDVTSNPGLSIKDIMAKQMVEDALKEKTINNNTVLVEGTSGNTGAGLAIIAAVLGMKIILIIPDKMSQEKIDRLKYLGAHVIVTPTSVAADDIKSYYSVRDYVTEKIEGWTSSQYHNLSNRKAHFEKTGPLIWEQTKGEITALISTAGTCGTVSGIGQYLKSKNKDIKIIAVDTIGSILYLLKEGYTIEEVERYATGYKIQGFGEDIHPKNLDLDVIDQFIRIGDATGFAMTRYLPAVGYTYGQSSGAAYAAIIECLDQGFLDKDDKVLTIFPDTGIPYRGDVYSREWIQSLGITDIIF